MPHTDVDRDGVAAVRRFNRFYTRQIGLLREGLLDSPFSLTESRVLYELANREHPTASDLIKELDLDAGYVSRILRGFKQKGLLESKPAASDARQSLLTLTKRGRSEFTALDARSNQEITGILQPLNATDRERLVEAMRTIEGVLGGATEPPAPVLLRKHRPGDLGTVVQMHGAIYAREYGFNEEFEALVADIVARFSRHYDSKWERCWMAEQNGRVVGSVFLVKESKKIAKLRLLLVDPQVRGLGLGAKLVGECVRFARQAGYRRITLWTQSVLTGARRVYEKAGFQLVSEEPRQNFGCDLISQTWELKL